MDAHELPEIMRFFEQDPVGHELARRIGEEGQSWAARSLRNDDMDVYMFRLMLEYAVCKMTDERDWAFHPECQAVVQLTYFDNGRTNATPEF